MSLSQFSFNCLLGQYSAGGQKKASQHLEEVPQAIRSAARGGADIQQYENIEGSKDVRSFPLATINVPYLGIQAGQQRIIGSGTVKVSWGLIRSAQGFRGQRSQGETLSLHTFFERYKQGGRVFICQWEMACISTRTVMS